jgi:putative tryptophan/tyrosine transport system substrate-binding protein
MHRRLALAHVAALASSLCTAASAQQPAGVPRLGFLGPANTPLLEVFRKALASLGHVEGRTLTIDARWPAGDQLDQMAASATELLKLKVDVMVAVGATAARAAMSLTSDVPIVFEVVVDPVATGLVVTLERPGANATGSTTFDPQFAARQFELLKSAIPSVKRVAILGDAGAAPTLFQAVEKAAQAVGIETLTLKVERVGNPDFEGAFRAAKQDGVQAVVVLSTPVTTPNRKKIAELAVKHTLPTLSPRDHADAGGLLSYGTSFVEATKHSAAVVDKILRGAKPADIPVERVSRHELIVNLAAARNLGVSIPAATLAGASQVLP